MAARLYSPILYCKLTEKYIGNTQTSTIRLSYLELMKNEVNKLLLSKYHYC